MLTGIDTLASRKLWLPPLASMDLIGMGGVCETVYLFHPHKLQVLSSIDLGILWALTCSVGTRQNRTTTSPYRGESLAGNLQSLYGTITLYLHMLQVIHLLMMLFHCRAHKVACLWTLVMRNLWLSVNISSQAPYFFSVSWLTSNRTPTASHLWNHSQHWKWRCSCNRFNDALKHAPMCS